MKVGKQSKSRKKTIRGSPEVIKDEITRKLGHHGWLEFPQYIQQEIEDKYLQMKNLGYI